MSVDGLYSAAEPVFDHWEVVKDLIDELIDIELNYRQSGHPGGSRSKVHLLVATMLSGAMRWDILRPWRRFADRFVLSAGHGSMLLYALLHLTGYDLPLEQLQQPPATPFPWSTPPWRY